MRSQQVFRLPEPSGILYKIRSYAFKIRITGTLERWTWLLRAIAFDAPHRRELSHEFLHPISKWDGNAGSAPVEHRVKEKLVFKLTANNGWTRAKATSPGPES